MTCRRLTSLACAAAFLLLGGLVLHAQGEQRSSWEGVYTIGQAERGLTVYLRNCARCHGPELAGIPDYGPALTDARFAANWDQLEAKNLYERIQVSMPEDDKGRLTRPEIVDLVALLFQRNQMPPGTTDLSISPADLRRIQIRMSR